jgi:demethylmenaquinone methyltransferase/2-methoxy-6-polyprenyl-1,4-benzoquinol methylase
VSAAQAGNGGVPPTPARAGAAPLRPFNCLWCGRPHTPRTADDLEAFALLCPDCVGRAQDNEFLRYRLREGLRARSAAAAAASPAEPPEPAEDQMKAYYAARAPEYDEVYAGLGLPAVERAVFHADLDAATLWLDGLPLSGEIVELAAGTGWWSPLLAQKGELSLYDVSEEVLDLARGRLVAHGLRAHIHLRDAWDEPDRQVDALFTGFWLSHVSSARLPDFLGLVRRWLKPGGTFAFIDEQPGLDYTPVIGERQQRKVKDGREFTITKVYRSALELGSALSGSGFTRVEVSATSRHFVLGVGAVPAAPSDRED